MKASRHSGTQPSPSPINHHCVVHVEEDLGPGGLRACRAEISFAGVPVCRIFLIGAAFADHETARSAISKRVQRWISDYESRQRESSP
jgi:hypothetical protein